MRPVLLRMVINTNIESFRDAPVQRVYAGGRIQNTNAGEVFSIVSGYLSINMVLVNGVVNNATWVLSRYDGANWLRSDSDFTLLDEENAGAGIASYTKQSATGNSVEDSTKFLNEGETKYGVVRKLVTKTLTIGGEEKTVYANIDVACKFVKEADGSVARYLMTDKNYNVLGEVGNGAHGYVLSGALVEGAPESELIVTEQDVNKSAGEYWAEEAQAITDFRSVTAFQYATT